MFDTQAARFEFYRLEYDYAAAEEKARGAGYRIGKWTDALYTLRRRLSPRRPAATL